MASESVKRSGRAALVTAVAVLVFAGLYYVALFLVTQ